MDTTTSTVGGGDEHLKAKYVSCITVDGVPILPPVMTEERRREMRSYKELAIQKEKELRERKRNIKTPDLKTPTENSPNLSPVQSTRPPNKFNRQQLGAGSSSSTTSPVIESSKIPTTSTPRTTRVYSSANTVSSKKVVTDVRTRSVMRGARRSETFSYMPEAQLAAQRNSPDVPEGVLRERKILIPIPTALDLNKTGSTDPSSPMSNDEEDEEREAAAASIASSNNRSDGSEDNFESAASSAGTFIVRKSEDDHSSQRTQQSFPHDENKLKPLVKSRSATTSEDEPEPSKENTPATVVRKPTLTAKGSFKRKRPAKYFVDDDEDISNNGLKSVNYSNIPHCVSIPEETNSDPKRSAPVSSTGTPSFSSIPHTNFSLLAKSLTNEFSQKFSSIISSNISATSSTTAKTITPTDNNRRPSSSGSYNVTLSKQIPSSADEHQRSDSDEVSNSSDKENRNTTAGSGTEIKQHVRKLSYTLANPSEALLQATSRDKNFAQTLETVPSEVSSIPSANPTPTKSGGETTNNTISIPFSFQTAGKKSSLSTSTNLNLEHGKQAHMQRFLNDHREQEERTQSQADSIEALLQKMKLEQEAKLLELAERHRQQELRIRQEFESELEKFKEKLSSTFNTTDSGKSTKSSPTSLIDSPSATRSFRSPRPLTGTSVQLSSADDNTLNSVADNSQKTASGMSGIAISERTRSGTSIYQFTGGVDSGGVNPHVNVGASVDLAGVGLSKLQSRMQMMSPAFFRTPLDAKSPLLKGLVFPDPLDKPQPPIRIPPKALEESMKVKFDRISAAVKGYLTRRLLHTEKVQIIIQTIRDTVDLILKLYEEAPVSGNVPSVRPQDSELHQRLIQQLTGACRSFLDVFFKLSTKERMAIIATDREKLRAKAMRATSSPSKPSISNATLKSIERRMSHTTHRTSPTKRDSRKSRVFQTLEEEGSQSVKPKPVKHFSNIVSPKRRRISYWDDGRSLTRSSTFASQHDLNGNNFKTPINSARSQISTSSSARSSRSRNHPLSPGVGDTFIVPSVSRGVVNFGNGKSNQIQASALIRRESTSRSAPTSSRIAQSSTSTVSVMSNSIGRSKGSSSRQPWNAVRH